MQYRVLNEYNGLVVVSDEDIEENIKSEQPLKRATVQAMGKFHNQKYLPLLYPVLYHENVWMRLDAARRHCRLVDLPYITTKWQYSTEIF